MKDPVKDEPLKYREKKMLRGLSYMNTIDEGTFIRIHCCTTAREPGPPDDAGLWKGGEGGLDISNLGLRIVRSR